MVKRRSFVKAALGTAVASYMPTAQSIAADIPALTLTGQETTLSEAMLKELSASLRGDVVLPGDADYDHVRRAWNGAFEKRPALIARCHGVADVTEAIHFARSNELVTAVRAGGHSMAGKSVCEGGNFGIVTAFEYQLHTVGPTVLNVANVYPYAQAREMLEFYFEFMQDAPDDLYIGAGLINRYSGSPINYVKLQQRNDDNNPHGRKYYSKSGFFNDVGSDLINNLVDGFDRAVTPRTVVLVSPLGGAVGRVTPDDTAFYHRDAQFNIEVALSWEDADVSADNIEWGRDFWRDVAPFASRGFYVNTEMDPSESRLRQNYGSNYDRLVDLKYKYDPKNMFRLNANIKPNA